MTSYPNGCGNKLLSCPRSASLEEDIGDRLLIRLRRSCRPLLFRFTGCGDSRTLDVRLPEYEKKRQSGRKKSHQEYEQRRAPECFSEHA